MLNRALQKEFKDGLPGSLYYLWSEDIFLLEDALARVVDIVISNNPVEFNYDLFYPSATSQQILDAASTLPFMAKRRLIVLKDFHQFPDSTINELIPYLNRPSESTCMILLSQKAPKKGLDVKWRVYHLNIKERDMPLWVKELSVRKGVGMTSDAIDMLLEFVGYDTGLLVMEVEKLMHSGKKTITSGDVISSITMMRQFTPFELVNCLVAGQKSKAFRILRAIFEKSNSAEAATVILGTLNWHYRQFYSLWLNKGRRPQRMREETYRSLIGYLPFYNEKRFYNIFRSLHEADIEIKTSGRAELVMEVLLINLLQEGQGS